MITHGKTRHPKTPAAAYDVQEWMQGLTEDSDGESKWNDDTKHMDLTKLGVTTHSGGAEVTEDIRLQRVPHDFLGNLWEAHHLQEETVSDGQNEHAVHSIQTR